MSDGIGQGLNLGYPLVSAIIAILTAILLPLGGDVLFQDVRIEQLKFADLIGSPAIVKTITSGFNVFG